MKQYSGNINLEFNTNIEELINYHQNDTEKERKNKNIFLLTLISLFIIAVIVAAVYFKPGAIGCMIAIIPGSLIIGGFINRMFQVPLRTPIVQQLYDLEKNKKLLKVTYDAEVKIVTYSYDEEGVVKHRHFTIDKVLTRTDIDTDTVYIGKEFIYARKWQS